MYSNSPPPTGKDYSGLGGGPVYDGGYTPDPSLPTETSNAYKDTGSNSGGGYGWDFPSGGGPGTFVPGEYFSGYVAPFDKVEIDMDQLIAALRADLLPISLGAGVGMIGYAAIQEPEKYAPLVEAIGGLTSALLSGLGSIISGIGEVVPG